MPLFFRTTTERVGNNTLPVCDYDTTESLEDQDNEIEPLTINIITSLVTLIELLLKGIKFLKNEKLKYKCNKKSNKSILANIQINSLFKLLEFQII